MKRLRLRANMTTSRVEVVAPWPPKPIFVLTSSYDTYGIIFHSRGGSLAAAHFAGDGAVKGQRSVACWHWAPDKELLRRRLRLLLCVLRSS